MNYKRFKEIADKNMPSGADLYLSVIENIFKTPARFVSQFFYYSPKVCCSA